MGLVKLSGNARRRCKTGHKRAVLENQRRCAVDPPLLAEREVAGDRVVACRLIRLMMGVQPTPQVARGQ